MAKPYPFDYETVREYKFYTGMKRFLVGLLPLLFRLEFKGLENIPQGGGYILALNHTSGFDPLLVGVPKAMSPLHFMAKAELFEKNALLGWCMKHMNAFPVHRGKGDSSAIDYGAKVLQSGHVMAICPEGKRIKGKDGVPQRAKAGIAVIAKATGADILPVAIHCDGPMKLFKKVVISYGPMIRNEELGMAEGTTQEIKDAANLVMGRIKDLWEAEQCK